MQKDGMVTRNENKKRILIIPSWYPTAKSPLSGIFFQEQFKALNEDFEVFVGFMQFRRINIVSFFCRLLTFRIFSHISKTPCLSPPESLCYISYGLSLRHFQRFIPPVIIEILDEINLYFEIRSLKHMLIHIHEKYKFRPDLIYSMTSQVNAVPTFMLSRIMGLPFITAEHAPFNLYAISNYSHKRVRQSLEQASLVLSVSEDKTRQILMNKINCYPVNVGNLVDENFFTLKPRARNDRFNILIVASYNWYKDYDTVFRAIQHLDKISTNPFMVSIVGISPSGGGVWTEGRDKFFAHLRQYSIEHLVRVYDSATRIEMVGHYHRADLFLLTSIQEGLPVSVLEAMSCGLPIFSTKCGGVEDIIDNTTGRLFRLKDYVSIAEEINKLLKDEICFDKVRIRNTVINLYGIERYRSRMRELINKTLADFCG